jgi:hypothetical protein
MDIISSDAAKNPKKFWSFIKGKKQESLGVAPLRETDGTLLVCLCGTCLSRSLSMFSLKEVHISLMVENGVAVNLLIYAVTSVLNSVIFCVVVRGRYTSLGRYTTCID